jgi:hypothetical protein
MMNNIGSPNLTAAIVNIRAMIHPFSLGLGL